MNKAIRAGEASPEAEDYIKGGLLFCGRCNTARQCEIVLFGNKKVVPALCKCRVEEQERAEREVKRQSRIYQLKRSGIKDPEYLKYTFAADDVRNPKFSDVCRRYVDTWDEMFEQNIGILFYGGVGTGKTFFAGCIANELINRLVSAKITSLPALLNQMQGFSDDREKIINSLKNYDLLVIDDLGVERKTEYALEQVYSIIDARMRQNKPLIITTNLPLENIKNPSAGEEKRIYDRIIKMCPIQIKIAGKSRRIEESEKRRALAKSILKE